MAYNRNVVRKQGLGFTTLDFAALRQQELERKRAVQEATEAERELAAMEAKRKHAEVMEAINHKSVMGAKKVALLNKLHTKLPNVVMMECFNYIFTKALPHDAKFVQENEVSIKNMGSLYMYKLGGIKALTEAVDRTNSSFLVEMLAFCKEFSNDIILEKVKEAQNAMSEEELREIVAPTITDEEREAIRSKMSTMGADELATLISNKVVDVVRDEQQREKDLGDTEKHMVTDLTSTDEEPVADTTEGFHIIDNDVTSNAKAFMENYNPITHRFDYDAKAKPKSFFYSLMCGVANKVIRESAAQEGLETPAQITPPQVVLENPLNINVFDIYIQDKNEDLYDLIKLDISDRPVIARTSSLDKDFILSEALLQYTLLETAHTMKLTHVTETDIRIQSDYLIKGQ